MAFYFSNLILQTATLKYNVTLNGNLVPYHVNTRGLLEIRTHIYSGDDISVQMVLPKVYKFLL